MIRPIVFVDLSLFTAHYLVKFKDRAQDGVLELRGFDLDGVLEDRPVLKEWKSARGLLTRLRAHAGTALKTGEPVHLGRAWIEILPGGHGTPWLQHEDDYAQSVIRTRTCMVPTYDAFTYSGNFREILSVGVVNLVEHRILHSETNFSPYPRVHLIVDIVRPDGAES